MFSTSNPKPHHVLTSGFLLIALLTIKPAEPKCSKGCDVALASYYIWSGVNPGVNLTFISKIFDTQIQTILSYNPQIPNQDSIQAGTRARIPFRCDCINGEFLGHVFKYNVQPRNTYDTVAQLYYSNLTTVSWLQRFNSYPPDRIPDTDADLNVTVNCSCGDAKVSKEYGLFITYPLRPGETLASVANSSGLDPQIVQDYNPNANFSSGSGLVYIPGKDQSGVFPPLKLSKGRSGGAITGISVAVGVVVVLLVAIFMCVLYRRKKMRKEAMLKVPTEAYSSQDGRGTGNSWNRSLESAAVVEGGSPRLAGITVDKSVEFSYEELAQATNDFSLANKIGEGGFGAVYYAELRGEKAAIKKMDMQATKEFLAELKVLTHVHHLNLVRLIGYCVESSLFLVYEFIENGNLSQHLRGSGSEPLPWSTRVQIALDSARGLEYIHEHTAPVYIHRDIKPANILIDHNFHGKVADFGLAKLTEVGSSLQTLRAMGTIGYMPPEYFQYGEVSSKIDVFAFGVVLYELISAKEAIVKPDGSSAESKGLLSMFEEVLNQPDPRDDLRKLVDPRLGDNYPFDAVCKLAQLAKACTHENPQLRPSMRSIVVALMTLSSATEDWDVGSFYKNQGLMNLMSGR